MSQTESTEHRAINVNDPGEANRQDSNLAQMAQNQEPMTIFTDGSEPLFTMYLKKTGYEIKLVDNWMKGIDNVVIFMSLFSAVVAALLSLTVPNLKEDPQNASAFYLKNIYKLQLADSNASRPLTPDQPPLFSAPKTAILVNALFFMSLCLNIFAAMLALSIRASVPNYLLGTESTQFSPHLRARTQEILASEWYGSKVFNALVAIFWLSPLFFFVGVSIYLFDINRAVFVPVLCCICLTFIVYVFTTNWLDEIGDRSKSSAGNDDRILNRLLDVLVEDSDFVHFLEVIPGFCRSSIVEDPLRRVTDLGKDRLRAAVRGLLQRTWSSHFLSDSEKFRRLAACVNFVDAVRLTDVALATLKDIFPRDWHNMLRSVEMGRFLRNQGKRSLEKIGLCAQCIIAGIISNVQESNERWVSLAADQLGKSEDDIRGYLECGNNNVLLVNLTHITRQILHSLEDDEEMAASLAFILSSFSNFDIRNTLPGLQSDFLALWAEIERAPNSRVRTEIRDRLLYLHNNLPPAQGPDESSPDGIPEATQRSAIAVASSHPAPPFGSQSRSATSQALPPQQQMGNVANTQSRERFTVLPDYDSVLPAMATSSPSSTTPEDLRNPIEMRPLGTRYSDTPAEDLNNPTGSGQSVYTTEPWTQRLDLTTC